LNNLLFDWGIKIPGSDLEVRALLTVPIGFLFLMPVSLKKDMSGFRYITFVSILAELYTGIVLVVQMPKYISYARAHPETYIVAKSIFDLNFFTGASIVFFAYTCSA